MVWDRQSPEAVQAPIPPALGRWVLVAVGAVLASVLLFLLYASGRIPQLQAVSGWVLMGLPLLICVLAFGARAYFYGGALNHHEFLEQEARTDQQAWQSWAQRHLAVHACCVLLPDQVCASTLIKAGASLPPATGKARRIVELPLLMPDRAQAALQLLLPALAPAMQLLPVELELRVTLLSDVAPLEYEALRESFQRSWRSASCRPCPAMVNLAAELSPQWIDEKLKSASSAYELIIVLQVHGDTAWSDGLAAMLLSPDSVAHALGVPVLGGLLRPMPLDIDTVEADLRLFLQTQTEALQATGLLADDADWQASSGKIIAASFVQNASLDARNQWIQESLCGPTGPLGHWLLAALAVDIVRHQQQPLLMLTTDRSQHWISTVTTGEAA